MTQEPLWRVRNADSASSIALALEIAAPPAIAALLQARGVSTAEEARTFLSPDASGLHDPLRMKGMEAAADLLVFAARNGRRIVVFGDYDVDGVTSVAQLRAALRRIGADAVSFLPHRLRDGYGLRPETVRRVIAEHRPAVIVTVDCGIGAVEGVACAREAGIDVIVTDHHLVPDELPAGAVVVNPRQPGCEYPEKDLAACGIAFKLAEAIGRRAAAPLSRESLLRLAALGTIADLVELRGENRVIAALGLAALSHPRSPGLRALLALSGVPAGVAPTAEEIAFRVAPRLNAAGRLDTAELALSLFEERDGDRARAIAAELSARNAERQAVERAVVAQARVLFAEEGDSASEAVVLLAAPGWHRGVLGIAASRLAREWHRPVLLFSVEGELARGSGRSIPGVSLHGILKEIGTLFDEFGGHDQAVGFSLPAARFPELRDAARALFRARVPAASLRPVQEAERGLDFGDISDDLWSWLGRLEPHGMGNPRPVFASRCRPAAAFRALGASGARGRVKSDLGSELDSVSWGGAAAALLSFPPSQDLDVHFTLRPGRGGRVEAEVVAARPAAAAREAVA